MKYFKYLNTLLKIFIWLCTEGTKIKNSNGIKKNDSKKLILLKCILEAYVKPL